MSDLGVALVGYGNIAEFHAKALATVPGAKLRAVQTSNLSKKDKIAEDAGHNVEVYEKLDEILARDDIHIISICTPSGMHLDAAVASAQAGKHVVVEKPLEITLSRCDQVIEACQQAGVKLCTIFPSRFSDVNVALYDAVQQGRFGKITLGDTTVKWWRSQEYYDSGGWRGTWQLDGGGALMNQAIHNVDLLQWLMGPVTEVAAFTSLLAHERIEVEDTAVACLKFANGSVGTITAATSVYPGLLKTVAIHGDKGSAVIEQDDLLSWQFAAENDQDQYLRDRFGRKSGSTGGASDPKAISFENHARQLADFVAAIQEDRAPKVDGAEGRKSVEIILAIYRSQATGQIVKLPLAQDADPPKMR